MKYSIFFIFILLITSCNHKSVMADSESRLDKINSEEEVFVILQKLSPGVMWIKEPKYPVPEKTEFWNEYSKKFKLESNFIKSDFDGNGKVDLLVINKEANDHHVILDLNDSLAYKSIYLGDKAEVVFPVVRENIIDLYYKPFQFNGLDSNNDVEKTSLVYKFGGFVEHNANVKSKNIESIEYRTTMCYGACPVFKLDLKKNGESTFLAERFNFNKDFRKPISEESEGEFSTRLKEEDWNKIVNLLNYLDFENLKKKYTVNYTDAQTAVLTIKYDNGKTKEITDYALVGTFGLKHLHQLMFDLRENQDWKKIK